MAVFRVERTKGFTVMSNYHLNDKTISLKAKGSLCLIPGILLCGDWQVSTRKALTLFGQRFWNWKSMGTLLAANCVIRAGNLPKSNIRSMSSPSSQAHCHRVWEIRTRRPRRIWENRVWKIRIR